MTYEWQIRPGDKVKVFPSDDNQLFYIGTVRYMPQATGDAWIIDDAGLITYQQTYNRIVRLERGK